MSNSLSIFHFRWGLLLGIACFLIACSTNEVAQVEESKPFECAITDASPKGNRLVGLDLLDLSDSGSFGDNMGFGAELGIDFIALHVAWTSIETTPNNLSDPGDALALLSQAAADNNLKFSLTIRPIDLTGKTVPSDLSTLRFNEVEMASRFKLLLDFIFTRVDPSVLLNLQIGNEIDGMDTSAEPETFWEDYGLFLKEITAYINTNHPNLKVGFTGTLPGLLQRQTLFTDLLQNVDILGVTYYPSDSNFNVKNPTTVFTDFDNLVAAFPDQPIYLQEVGYQTSAENDSSEEKQAEFYCNFFKAWDIHKNRIVTASIVRLHDYSQAAAIEGAGPYGISDSAFIEYLRSLGIRNFDGNGSHKQAFSVIKQNLGERGW